MIFSNFIKPKWQHPDPQIRQSEVSNLDDPEILTEVAQNDDAAEVRRTALNKMSDLELLEQIALKDKDSNVQESAEQRLKQLLCCQNQKNDCPSLEARLAWTNNATHTELITYIAQKGPEVELRIAAVEKIRREGLLGDIAINDSAGEVRLAAAQKLTQKSTLERVVKGVRNHDKRVSRIVREKLDQLLELQERPAQIQAECDAIVSKLENLAHRLTHQASDDAHLVQAVADETKIEKENNDLKQLLERWQVIATEAKPDAQTRFEQAQQTVHQAMASYQQAFLKVLEREQAKTPLRVAKKTLCEQMEAWVIELKKRERIGGEDEKAFYQSVNDIQKPWAETQPIDDPQEEQQWQARFERALQSVQKRHQKLQHYDQIANQLEALCAKGSKWLTDNTEIIQPDSLKKLQAHWKQVQQPDKPLALFSELNRCFETLTKDLQARFSEQKTQRSKQVQELKQVLQDLEEALERGELKAALPLEQEARLLFENLKGYKADKALERRLQTCGAKIGKLRSWQSWGNKLEREKLCEQVENWLKTEADNPENMLHLTEEAQTAWKRLGSSGYSRERWEQFNKAGQMVYERYREYLCQQMEQLLNEPDEKRDPEETAKKIRLAQATWKNLGSQGHSQELWERFNNACQTAYEPCRSHFSIKSQHREQNLYQKQSICERLETFERETHWENPKWKEAYRFVREAEKEWRDIGPTDRKLKKDIQRRFQAAMQVLETHLDVERQRNCRKRLHLIGEVEKIAHQLQESIDSHGDTVNKEDPRISGAIDEAIKKVKKLQDNWKVTVPGNRRIEREFWKTFRSACDLVFNHRKEQQEAHKKEIQSYLASKIKLCEKVEALATLEGEAIKTIPEEVKQVKEEWQKTNADWNKMGSPLRKKAKAEAVEERFDKACRRVNRRYQEQLAIERREQINYLKQKAAFCVELEQANSLIREEIQTEPDWHNLLQAAFAELPKLDNVDWETTLEQRFQTACTLASTGEPPVSENALKEKETLCIRMEILAGIESPPEAAQARLAYKVTRLSAAMRDGERESAEPQVEAEEIERTWYLTGAVPSDKTQSLEQRFSQACQAFYSQ
jgi:DNA repair protein SbcC/Rad50